MKRIFDSLLVVCMIMVLCTSVRNSGHSVQSVETTVSVANPSELVKEHVCTSLSAGVSSRNVISTRLVSVEDNDSAILSSSEEPESAEDKIVLVGDTYTMYTTATDLNLRLLPTRESKRITGIPFNSEIEVQDIKGNNEWVAAKYKDYEGFVAKQYLQSKKAKYVVFNMPWTDGTKSFMYNTTIRAWKQADLKAMSYIGDKGMMMYDDRYCIALGTAVTTQIGQYVDLVLANGTVIPCILGDVKADCDTRSDNVVTKYNGCATEFIVSHEFDKYRGTYGDVSYVQDGWNSRVVQVRLYDKCALR